MQPVVAEPFTSWGLLGLALCPLALLLAVLLIFVWYRDDNDNSSSEKFRWFTTDLADADAKNALRGMQNSGWVFPAKEDREQRRLRWARAMHLRLKRAQGLTDYMVRGRPLFTADQLIIAMNIKARGICNFPAFLNHPAAAAAAAASSPEPESIRLRLLISLLESGPPQTLQPIREDARDGAADSGGTDESGRRVGNAAAPWLSIDVDDDDDDDDDASQSQTASIPRPYGSAPQQQQQQPQLHRVRRMARSRSATSVSTAAPDYALTTRAADVSAALVEMDPIISLPTGYATRQVVWDAMALLARGLAVAAAS